MRKKLDVLVMLVLAVSVVACQATASPIGSATVSSQPPTIATAQSMTVAAALTSSPMAMPVSPSAIPSFSVTITPTEQTLPAGAATSFFVGVPQWHPGLAPIHWSVSGMPSRVTAEFLPDAFPANSTLVLDSPCALPQGNYTFEVQATISQTMQSVKAQLDITDRLTDTRPDSATASLAADLITVRRGGPSTARTGPFRLLAFCESAESRTLVVQIQSATTEAGTSATEPPHFTLFKSLVWPAPTSIQTVSGGYRANAREVANSDGWDLKWNTRHGVYVLAFLQSPFEIGQPAEKRPSSVTYRLDLVH
ncbi:MAG: hypothetical protein KGJ80_13730 [Chloroflexota bacterium]|nr:hypothetical protein [Chloroflexota bacterium]